MKILAVDPGYEKMGVAVVEKINGKEILIFSECFKTKRSDAVEVRLCNLGKEIEKIIEKYKPKALAIEKLFFADNQKTAMRVSEARGVIIYECTRGDLSIKEYTPLEVKVAVTGYGRSDKAQVKFMVEKLLVVGKKIKEDDEYDAIALGLTYFAREKTKITNGKF
ncbi:MAG: crossover junction endodeoxyribonuclease RuvC [Patescibacteria group bacterium]